MATAGLLVLFTTSHAFQADRETINFDFAWRHLLGEPAHGRVCGAVEPGVNYGAGGSRKPNVASAANCCALCAESSTCAAWDFNTVAHDCWLKTDATGRANNTERISGRIPLPAMPAAAKAGFDDAAWEVVDVPHDMLIKEPVLISNTGSQGYRARNVGWYRKHFTLPAEWSGSAVWLYIEGAFHVTTAWLNGVSLGTHDAGYTSFWLRLDGDAAVWGGPNVLALHVDASSGTGWWYEGGGLMRHTYLVCAPKLHIAPDSAWAHANVTSFATPRPLPSHGAAASATLYAALSVVNERTATAPVSLAAQVFSETGVLVASAPPSPAVSVDVGQSATLDVRTQIDEAELWSVGRPYLYTVALWVSVGGQVVDQLNVTAGIRSVDFDAASGLSLNGQPLKIRGFCDHSNMGGVGGAVPDRLNLYRAQALRAVGANAWRMAHNPPIPARLDIMDRLGMLAMDENRDYGGHKGQGGTTAETVAQELHDMTDMVRRDRSHPSVFVWSFCNEVGCNNESAAAAFRAVSKLNDPTRPVTQNHLGSGTHPLSMKSLDVQGFSHKSADDFDTFHENNPNVPEMATECCSCLSQRGVDVDDCPNPRPGGCKGESCGAWCGGKSGAAASDGTFYNNEIGVCTAEQVNRSDARPFVAGTFVWSGFDYLGESRGFPQTVKCRGVVLDAAGFRKESAWWMQSLWAPPRPNLAAARMITCLGRHLARARSNGFARPRFGIPSCDLTGLSPAPHSWLSKIPLTDAGRPPLPDVRTVRIVEAWRAARPYDRSAAPANRTIHVYTDAPALKLLVNGQPAAPLTPTGEFGVTVFSVPFVGGNLTAVACSADGGTQLARHSVMTAAPAASIRLSLDAPSAATGTGGAVVADGEDVALVRAELLDAAGNLATDSSAKLSFSIVSGDGHIWGTHSGNPADTAGPDASSKAAYHGLLRVVVRSSSDHASPAAHRRRLRQIDLDGGKGDSVRVASPDEEAAVVHGVRDGSTLPPIVIRAEAEGIQQAATLEIRLTTDLGQLPLAVAANPRLAHRLSADAF